MTFTFSEETFNWIWNELPILDGETETDKVNRVIRVTCEVIRNCRYDIAYILVILNTHSMKNTGRTVARNKNLINKAYTWQL